MDALHAEVNSLKRVHCIEKMIGDEVCGPRNIGLVPRYGRSACTLCTSPGTKPILVILPTVPAVIVNHHQKFPKL
jgi:hypothetical protein